jgi:hypothetical protein
MAQRQVTAVAVQRDTGVVERLSQPTVLTLDMAKIGTVSTYYGNVAAANDPQNPPRAVVYLNKISKGFIGEEGRSAQMLDSDLAIFVTETRDEVLKGKLRPRLGFTVTRTPRPADCKLFKLLVPKPADQTGGLAPVVVAIQPERRAAPRALSGHHGGQSGSRH